MFLFLRRYISSRKKKSKTGFYFNNEIEDQDKYMDGYIDNLGNIQVYDGDPFTYASIPLDFSKYFEKYEFLYILIRDKNLLYIFQRDFINKTYQLNEIKRRVEK